MALKANFITRYRTAMAAWLSATESLIVLKKEYDAEGYSALVDGDFTGANVDLTAAQFTGAVGNFTSIDSNATTNNYYTNLYRLRL